MMKELRVENLESETNERGSVLLVFLLSINHSEKYIPSFFRGVAGSDLISSTDKNLERDGTIELALRGGIEELVLSFGTSSFLFTVTDGLLCCCATFL